MTIVISQSGDTVINADKIVAFGIQETNSIMNKGGWSERMISSYSIYADYGTGAKVISNFYSSKEKAMKILKEMTCAIQTKTYYSLPKDEE